MVGDLVQHSWQQQHEEGVHLSVRWLGTAVLVLSWAMLMELTLIDEDSTEFTKLEGYDAKNWNLSRCGKHGTDASV